MLVTSNNQSQVLAQLQQAKYLSLDTETTGLKPYDGDRLFAVVISDGEQDYYWDFSEASPRAEGNVGLAALLAGPTTFFLHNAKFDMHFLHQAGLDVTCPVWCTLAQARVEFNDHMQYGLDACAKRIGIEGKLDAVKAYVKEHKLWEWEQVPGKKVRTKHMHFDQVPQELMQEYAERDARITYQLGMHQLNQLTEAPETRRVYENEALLTQTCQKMEQVGVKIDRDYCQRAASYEGGRADNVAGAFEIATGVEFKDSGKVFAEVFTAMGLDYPKTEKGNPSFTADVLKDVDHEIARTIEQYRDAHNRANYYHGFLYHADPDDCIHPDMKQGGTATGRFSYSNPNLQNLTKEEDNGQEFMVRRALVPREGYVFCMMDYDQMEYRMMLDYAQEMPVIEQVLSGVDVHTATAQMMGVDRKTAKTINFMLLYGGGVAKLATALNIGDYEAKCLRNLYFERLPKVEELIKRIQKTARSSRKFVRNWMGRRSHFPDPNFVYKAPNYLIQGGCADVVKLAMNRLDVLLAERKSRMLLQVHDEILFEIHEKDMGVVEMCKDILESSYEADHLPLTVGVEWGRKSWADREESISL
jgi:DNA polymerase-1